MRWTTWTLLGLLTVLVLLVACGGDPDSLMGDGNEGGRARGRALFVGGTQPPCGSCHTLADAGTQGTAGPDLDDLTLPANVVREALTAGHGALPALGDQLDPEEIDLLAGYVSGVAG